VSNWQRYTWADFDPVDLPWSFQTEQPVMPVASRFGFLSDPGDRNTATGLGFDPDHTYFTVLNREWGDHPAGSRVLLEAVEIAIERGADPIFKDGA
jgi:hypothetical protein